MHSYSTAALHQKQAATEDMMQCSTGAGWNGSTPSKSADAIPGQDGQLLGPAQRLWGLLCAAHQT